MSEAKKAVLIRLVPNSAQPATCKGCGKPILWMNTLNGKRMPMNYWALPHHQDVGVDVYAADDSHWASCSARAQFDKRESSHA